MSKIFVVGSSNTDMVVKAPHIPAPGETILGGNFLMNPGGKGANQAVAAARLGGDIVFVARVGDDLFGHETLAQMAREKIATTGITVDPTSPSGVALIMVDAAGRNCISVASGANMNLTPEDFDRAVAAEGKPGLLLAQLETPIKTIVHVAQFATAHNLPFILNPAPACDLPADLFRGLYLATPNETEAGMLTGVSVDGLSGAEAAARALCAKGVKNVVITLGSSGSYWFDGQTGAHVPARRVKAVDTTAAGDTFNGALAVALSEGRTLPDAVAFASNASAVAVTRMGAQASTPYRKELEA